MQRAQICESNFIVRTVVSISSDNTVVLPMISSKVFDATLARELPAETQSFVTAIGNRAMRIHLY